jgi:lytic murein transglycosylase
MHRLPPLAPPIAACVLALLPVPPASAQSAPAKPAYKVNPPTCQNTGSFDRWLDGFRKEAAASGIKPATIAAALSAQMFDGSIIARDRRQGFFQQSFLEFSDKLISKNRLATGPANMKRHAGTFVRAEEQWGVPAAVITAFWALESDFGSGMGNLPVLRSLATLAYDCRRGEMFRAELLAALRIIDRGDLKPTEMIGSWAGELGQTQFLPSHYFEHAVDFDGDGRRDLLRSAPDIIASTSAFIVSLGWKRGEPWLEEVKLPADMPWAEADLAIKHPRSRWGAWGVRRANGQPLVSDARQASLLLLMGRSGPAFLAYPNFDVFLQWNQSLTYATTVAYLATRYNGAPAMSRGNGPVEVLNGAQLKELQLLLLRGGYMTGEADGKLGAGTRAAIKKAQARHGLPADSYPTLELVQRLQRRG